MVARKVALRYKQARCVYTGPAPSSKETSITANVSKFVQSVLQSYIEPGMRILDWGAGKVARVADLLRAQGHDVYAYDPYNGNGVDGRSIGAVSTFRPEDKFDVAFTSFVLNVVKEDVENQILAEIQLYADRVFHICRGRELAAQVERALIREDPLVVGFFKDFYGRCDPDALARFEVGGVGWLTEADFLNFAAHGFITPKGFQRLPMLKGKGYPLVRETTNYKVYAK
jgi:hypothetical protein